MDLLVRNNWFVSGIESHYIQTKGGGTNDRMIVRSYDIETLPWPALNNSKNCATLPGGKMVMKGSIKTVSQSSILETKIMYRLRPHMFPVCIDTIDKNIFCLWSHHYRQSRSVIMSQQRLISMEFTIIPAISHRDLPSSGGHSSIWAWLSP